MQHLLSILVMTDSFGIDNEIQKLLISNPWDDFVGERNDDKKEEDGEDGEIKIDPQKYEEEITKTYQLLFEKEHELYKKSKKPWVEKTTCRTS